MFSLFCYCKALINMILLLLFSSALFLIIIWWCIRYYQMYNGLWDIPAPRLVLPILGHSLEAKSVVDALWILHRLTMDIGKGKAIRLAIGFNFCLNIVDPEFLEHIMTHTRTINKAFFYKFMYSWLGRGLLTSMDDKWRMRRKLLTPAYHFKILEQFIDVFDRNSNILVEKLEKQVGEQHTDVFPYITLCALDTICETAMGTPINAQINENSEYVKATKTMTTIVVSRAVNLFKLNDCTYKFTQDYRDEVKALDILHGHTRSVINSRRNQLLKSTEVNQIKNSELGSDECDAGHKKKIPFLDLLLQSSINGAPLTDEDIREEVETFMFEGHDTVSSGMSFCIYCLSNNPEIQEKCIIEQREIFGTNAIRHTTYEDLQEMKYLEMVIKESLRLYPPVPLYGRTATEDFTYKNYTIKKGTQIGIGAYTLHRHPDIYPDPEKFDPQRFTPENQSKRHPFAYIPFSAGFRNCVGQKFAMLEMKSTISKLLRNFKFEPAVNNKLRLKSEIILTTETGVNVKIHRRVW